MYVLVISVFSMAFLLIFACGLVIVCFMVTALKLNGVYVSRGQCLIINEIHYQSKGNSKIKWDRGGTIIDAKNLKDNWEKAGCEVHIRADLTRLKMDMVLNDFRKNLECIKPDFIVVIILSHGRFNRKTGLDEILCCDLEALPTDEILDRFIDAEKCPAMVNKPKLFYIQACRGSKAQINLEGLLDDTDVTPNLSLIHI